MTDYNQQVAQRLHEVAKKYGGTSAFARMIKRTPQTLRDYLNGATLPGNKIRQAMIDAGLGNDEYYVMHGAKEEIDAKHLKTAENIYRNAHPEKGEMLDIIEKHKIETAEELDRRLRAYESMRGMVLQGSPATHKSKGKKK